MRDWLERIRAELERGGTQLKRPTNDDGEASERVADWQDAVDQLFAELTDDVPIDPAERTAKQQAQWLAAGVLDFHRREDKAAWWEFFRLHDCAPEELLEESLAIVGLTYKSRVGGTERAPHSPLPLHTSGNQNRRRRADLRGRRQRAAVRQCGACGSRSENGRCEEESEDKEPAPD